MFCPYCCIPNLARPSRIKEKKNQFCLFNLVVQFYFIFWKYCVVIENISAEKNVFIHILLMFVMLAFFCPCWHFLYNDDMSITWRTYLISFWKVKDVKVQFEWWRAKLYYWLKVEGLIFTFAKKKLHNFSFVLKPT